MSHRLGICIAGLNGAVASTLAAGVALLRRRLVAPTGLMSEPCVASHGLAACRDIAIGGWDPRGETLLAAARRNAVVPAAQLQPVARELRLLKPWPLPARRQPLGRDLARQVAQFRAAHRLDAVVVLNLLPTGAHAASALYARAAAAAGCPFVNFTPNDCGEAALAGIPFAGRDGKTGQTWFKSVLAPALRDRALRIDGWYSTNLLGNEDGRVVGHPATGRAKIRDKTRLLGQMLGYEPHHLVQINYYPPRGDDKESWDNIDFQGFLGLRMQLKVNALYRDSVLAAPMCLDLCRFIAWAHRRGARGPQEWLSLYFKAPYAANPARRPAHDFFAQLQALRDYLDINRPGCHSERSEGAESDETLRGRGQQSES